MLQAAVADLIFEAKEMLKVRNTLANSFAPAAVIEPLLASDHLN